MSKVWHESNNYTRAKFEYKNFRQSLNIISQKLIFAEFTTGILTNHESMF